MMPMKWKTIMLDRISRNINFKSLSTPRYTNMLYVLLESINLSLLKFISWMYKAVGCLLRQTDYTARHAYNLRLKYACIARYSRHTRLSGQVCKQLRIAGQTCRYNYIVQYTMNTKQEFPYVIDQVKIGYMRMTSYSTLSID